MGEPGPRSVCVSDVGLPRAGSRRRVCAGGPYEDATSAEPLPQSSTGSPPFGASHLGVGSQPGRPPIRPASTGDRRAVARVNTDPIVGQAALPCQIVARCGVARQESCARHARRAPPRVRARQPMDRPVAGVLAQAVPSESRARRRRGPPSNNDVVHPPVRPAARSPPRVELPTRLTPAESSPPGGRRARRGRSSTQRRARRIASRGRRRARRRRSSNRPAPRPANRRPAPGRWCVSSPPVEHLAGAKTRRILRRRHADEARFPPVGPPAGAAPGESSPGPRPMARRMAS